MTTNWAWFIIEGHITMPWSLSWDDDNWRSMIHTLGMYNHALSVVMRRWQLTEHDWYLRDLLPCSDRCHKTMATDGACYIWYITCTMLWVLSWDDDNWGSMIHTLGINKHALTVVMRHRQLTEQVSFPLGCITMLCPLSWDDDNWQSMIDTLGIYYHALTVVIRRWQLTDQVSYMNGIFPCSDRCHKTMIPDRACYIPLR